MAFPRMGFITAGNPNHYSGAGLLLKELRKRATEDENAKESLEEFEEAYKEDYGKKPSEASVIRHNEGDGLGDRLSDLAPEGTVFEIRKDRHGNSNYGYFVFGSSEDDEDEDCDHEFHENPERDGQDVCIHCGETDG